MTKLTAETKSKLRVRSRLAHLGRDSEVSQGFINIPAFRGSTVLHPDVATLKGRNQRYTYGTRGTPTTSALTEAWSDLSGAAGTVLVPSGLTAIAIALMTALKRGRSSLDDRRRLFSRAQLRRERAEADGRRDDLLRSRDRRRHRGSAAPEHAKRSTPRRPARKLSTCRTFPPYPRRRMRAASA